MASTFHRPLPVCRYGNFQLVTGYSDGPLAMNFSVCNDANAAEQEGHGKVPFFKFQPTLNYELDL